MPRKSRIYYPGAIYHVILRGNNRQEIFFKDAHRYEFYDLLADIIKKYDCTLHAFCLMSNHIHMMIQVKQIPLSKIIQNLASRYAIWLHKQIGRVGHLFQGRFKAFLIQNDSYMLELCRYIHLNPLRAKMVDDAAQYRWSSHKCYLDLENIPWVTTEYILQILQDNFTDKNLKYCDFIKLDIDYEFKPSLDIKESGEIVIRDKVQKASNENYIKPLNSICFDDMVRIVCRELAFDSSELKMPGKKRDSVEARAFVAMYAQDYCRMKLVDVAELLERSPAALGEGVNLLRKRRTYSKSSAVFTKIEQALAKSEKPGV